MDEVMCVLSDSGFAVEVCGQDLFAVRGGDVIVISRAGRGYYAVATTTPSDDVKRLASGRRGYSEGLYSAAKLIFDGDIDVAPSKIHLWNHDHTLYEIKSAVRV